MAYHIINEYCYKKGHESKISCLFWCLLQILVPLDYCKSSYNKEASYSY